MALQKEIPTNSGVTGNYLRILRINSLDFTRKTAEVTVGLYLDKESAKGGKSPLQSKSFTVTIADLDGNLRKQIYPQLKLGPDDKEKNHPLLRQKGKFNNVELAAAKDV